MDTVEKRAMYDKLVAAGMKSSQALKEIENMEYEVRGAKAAAEAKELKAVANQKPLPIAKPKIEKEPGFLSGLKRELMRSGESQREKEELRKAAKAAYKQEKTKQAGEYGRGRARLETRVQLLQHKRRLLEGKQQQSTQRQEVHPAQSQASMFTMPDIHTSKLAGRSMFQFSAQPAQKQPRPERPSKKIIQTRQLDIFKPSKIFR